MITFETVQARAQMLAEIMSNRGLRPHVRLPLLKVTNENHVPIYTNGEIRDLWVVGYLWIVNDGEKTRSPVYLTADATIVCLRPLCVSISTGFEASGWPAQHGVNVLALREVDQNNLTDAQIHDLYDVLCSA